MIPPPALDSDGVLLTASEVTAGLTMGLLTACCVCKQSSAFHWGHERRYVPLHERCVGRLLDEWREMIDSGQADVAPPTGRPTGAYARRASVATRPVIATSISIDEGSPYFRPGMSQGAPWTAVALLDGQAEPMICPCNVNEAHARAVAARWRILAGQGGYPLGGRRLTMISGHVVTPTGDITGAWSVTD